MFLPRLYWWKMGYPISNRGVSLVRRPRTVRFFWQVYFAVATPHEDKPPPTLRYSILGEFDRPIVQFVTCLFQLPHEPAEGLTTRVQFLQSRYVLHKHEIRPATFHKSRKTGKQGHALIQTQLRSYRILLGVGLTWRAPTEKHRVRSLSLHPGSDCSDAHLADICQLETSIGKVDFEACSGIRIVI